MTATRKPLVYVAGPITRDPFGCVRQATEAFTWLRDAGCVPFLPQLSVIHEMVSPLPYDEWLAYDHDVIDHCDALVRLPGESPGADKEVAYAKSLGLRVFLIGNMPVRATERLIREWIAREANDGCPPDCSPAQCADTPSRHCCLADA